MLVDLNLRGKAVVVIILDEKELRVRLRQLRETGAKIFLVTTTELAESIHQRNGEKVLQVSLKRVFELSKITIERIKPFLTVIYTQNEVLDEKLQNFAKSFGSLIYTVDSPRLNDLNMPAVAHLGQIRVAISTGGASPAMASMIRQRIENEIRKEDILQVKLQGRLRKEIKKAFPQKEERKRAIYKMISDRTLSAALRKGNYSKAKRIARSKLRRTE